MSLSLAAALVLASQCAPAIAPETLLSVVHVESRFNPLAIGVNGTPSISVSATSRAEAIAKAAALISAGRSLDLGLAQINSANLGWLGLTVEDAFDPCTNLAAAARVLQDGYRRSAPHRIGEQAALRTAFSYYNTGKPTRGVANGYVAKVTRAAAHVVPAIRTVDETAADLDPSARSGIRPPPAWDVFAAHARSDSFVIRPSASPAGVLQ